MIHVNLNPRLNCHGCWAGRGSHPIESSQIFLSVSISLSSSSSNIFTVFLLLVPHSQKWFHVAGKTFLITLVAFCLFFSSFKKCMNTSLNGSLWVTDRATTGRQGVHSYSFESANNSMYI